jgi:prevent-host-death family protein
VAPPTGIDHWTDYGYTSSYIISGGRAMRFATVAEVKNRLSEYLAKARRRREPILITHHGKPYALIQPLSERALEDVDWQRLTRRRLAGAWEDEPDALYDYL